MTQEAEIDSAPGERYVSHFTELMHDVKQAGLLERRHGYYWLQIGAHVGAFFAVWVGFFWLGNSWFQLILAAALGVVVTQFGFLGHDAAHRQMFTSAACSPQLGLSTSRTVGLGSLGAAARSTRSQARRPCSTHRAV